MRVKKLIAAAATVAVLVVSALIGLLAIGAYRTQIVPVVSATPAFAKSMSRQGTLQPVQMIPPGAPPGALGVMMSGAELPLAPAASLFILVAHDPQAAPGSPTMQLQVCRITTVWRGAVERTLGNPRVLCDLSGAEAQAVLDTGVPQGLRDAMLAAAAPTNWSGGPPRPDIRIDPRPYFAASTDTGGQ